MKKKKKIIAIVIVAIVGTVIFWKRVWLMEKLGLGPSADGQSAPTGQEDYSPAPNPFPSPSPAPVRPKIDYKECTYPIKLGCKGKNVKLIQESLNRNHNARLTTDGYFGPMTEKALLANGYKKELNPFDAIILMYKKA